MRNGKYTEEFKKTSKNTKKIPKNTKKKCYKFQKFPKKKKKAFCLTLRPNKVLWPNISTTEHQKWLSTDNIIQPEPMRRITNILKQWQWSRQFAFRMSTVWRRWYEIHSIDDTLIIFESVLIEKMCKFRIFIGD